MARDIRKKTNGGYLTLDDKATKNTDLQAGNNTFTPQDNAFRDNLINAVNNWKKNNPTNGGNGSGRWNNGNGNPLENWWNNNVGGNNNTITPGSYQSAYSGTINSLINQAINRQPFEWDPATDQAYQAYARMYTRLGEEAGRDTLADVASNTGGLASSYATTASQQARGAYNQALTDKIPELMQLAYDRYRNEYNDALAGINTLQGVDDSLYNRFATDRSYNRGVYENDRDYDRSVFESDRGYNRGVYESDRDFDESVRQYNQNYELDKNAQEYERMLNMWTSLGYANSEVAKYFGVPEGTKTDESAYRWAQFALSQAGSGSSGGGGGGGGGRRSSGYSGGGSNGSGGSNGGLSDKDRAYIAKGETNRAINALNAFGQYLAQGGMTASKQAAALRSFKEGKLFNSLNEYEQAYVLARLNGYQP